MDITAHLHDLVTLEGYSSTSCLGAFRLCAFVIEVLSAAWCPSLVFVHVFSWLVVPFGSCSTILNPSWCSNMVFLPELGHGGMDRNGRVGMVIVELEYLRGDAADIMMMITKWGRVDVCRMSRNRLGSSRRVRGNCSR